MSSAIIIASVWLFATACALSKQITGAGVLLAIIAALVVTFYFGPTH